MRQPFSFLSNSDAFEELTYDVLEAEGFKNLKWRGPSADGGRDIEAEWHSPDPVGGIFNTKWYVECKWYSDSVPFDEIEPKLFAALTERVGYVLLVTSSMVRNTALDAIEKWLSARGNPFQFRYWTGRDILHRVVRHADIFSKHFPSLSPPNWSNRIRELQKLEVYRKSNLERQNWRVIPSLQWCTRKLKWDSSEVTISNVRAELEFIMANVRLSEFLDGEIPAPPSLSHASISDILNDSIQIAQTKSNKKFSRVEIQNGVHGHVSSPLTRASFFELAYNCLQYSTNDISEVSLTSSNHSWQASFVNSSSESLTSPWPVIGFRSDFSKMKNSSGQGVGCWLSSEAMKSQGLSLDWIVKDNRWSILAKGSI